MFKRVLVAALALGLAFGPAVASEQIKGAVANTPAAQSATASQSAVVEKGLTGSTATITVPASTEAQQYQIDVKPLIDGLLPFIISAVGGIITVLGGLLTYWLKKKFNIDVDAKHREAWQQTATNAAGALIAAGAVRIEQASGQITVDNATLARVINTASARAPDAIKHFGFTPEDMRGTIIAKIPQVLGLPQAPLAPADLSDAQPAQPEIPAAAPGVPYRVSGAKA